MNHDQFDEWIETQNNLWSKIKDIFGSNEKAIHWIDTKNKALGNVTPAVKMLTYTGCKEVEDLLGRIEHGVID